MTKRSKELHEVGHGGVAKDLTRSSLTAAQPLGQMRNQTSKLAQERLLGQLHGFLKAPDDAFLLLL